VYTVLMLIFIHVIIAITSIIIATIGFISPSLKKLALSYGFILATVASGTLLMITVPSHILQSCLSGLSYLTIASMATIATHVRLRRLAAENN
jgi:hypothetical protein